MRGIALLLVVIALAVAGYLYQQNLGTTGQQLGADSPQEIKPRLDQIGRDVERQMELGTRRVEEATR
jgi:hypothetical protein